MSVDQFTEWQEAEFIKCASSFSYFSANYLRILHPKEGLVNFKLYGYQERVVQAFNEHRFNIMRKFRQGGLTTLSVTWALWRCMFKMDQVILIMSRTDREAVEAGEIVARAIRSLKSEHPWLTPRLLDSSKHEKTFADTNSRIMCYGPEGARGKAVTYLIIDEAAFVTNMEEYWIDMYPIVSTGGNVIVISTVNGIGNWYEETYHEAERGENEFHIIELDYLEHPDYCDPEWARATRRQIGEKGWRQEVLREFIGSGDNYIKTEVLQELDDHTRNRPPIKKLFEEWDTDKVSQGLAESKSIFKGSELDLWTKGALWIWKEPKEGSQYIIGVDVAEGVGDDGDNSAFQIIDSSTCEQVGEFSSNLVPPQIYAMIIARIGMYYNEALVAVENVGPGLAVIDKLIHTLYYGNLYYHRVKTQEKPGIVMNKSIRPVVLESMQNYIENRLCKINSTRLVRELKTFVFDRNKKRAEARKGHHDDLIMALSIAFHVRDHHVRDVPLGAILPDNITESHKNSMLEKIRKEIEDAAPEDFFAKKDDEKHPWEYEDLLPGAIFKFERPQEGLLKEFDW